MHDVLGMRADTTENAEDRLHEQWRLAEAEHAARGRVIRELQTELHRFENECAARLRVIQHLQAECAAQLRVIEELGGQQRRREAEFAAQVGGYERRLRRFRWVEGIASAVRRLGRFRPG